MARLNEIKEKRATIAVERADIAEYLGQMDTAAADEETERRWRERIERNAALSKEDAKLAQLEAIEAANAEAERRAAGKPVGGGAAPVEMRVFSGSGSTAPQGFDGEVWISQTGERIPLLEARHKLADFAPRTEARSAAEELGLGGFIRAVYHGPQTATEKRALAEATPGAGGVLVPTPLSAEIIDLMRPRSVAFQAGARVVPMSSQTLRLARVTAYPVMAWRAELAALAQDQPTFDSVTLQAKSAALIVRVSRELLEDGQNLDATLRGVFANAAAIALDAAVLWGNGTSNVPLGAANQPGVLSVAVGGANGGQLPASWVPVLDALAALEAANAGPPTAMILNPRTSRTINGFMDSTGNFLAPPPVISGLPKLVTTSVPITQTVGTSNNASSILIGDFRSLLIGMRTSLTITTLTERYADTGEVAFCLWMRADSALTHGASICKITGITP